MPSSSNHGVAIARHQPELETPYDTMKEPGVRPVQFNIGSHALDLFLRLNDGRPVE